jgi:GxxExxY protein
MRVGKPSYIYQQLMKTRSSVTSIEPPTWKNLSSQEQVPWQLLSTYLKASRPVQVVHELTPHQLEVVSKARQQLAHYPITRLIRALPCVNIVQDVKKAAHIVYNTLDWGWQEKMYQEALKIQLDTMSKGRYMMTSEIPHTSYYMGHPLGDGVYFRTDILIMDRQTDRQVLLELKADVATANSMSKAVQQCKRYLKNKKIPVGLVINFPDRSGQRVRFKTVFG